MSLPHGFAVALGYDGLLLLFPTSSQEHRLWQQGSHEHQWGAVKSDVRVRLEQRFFSAASGVSVRGRFLVGVDVSIVGDVAFVLRNEFFVSFNQIENIDPRGFSENRLFAGFEWGPKDWLTATLGYQNQWIAIFEVVNHTLVLRLRFEVPTGATTRAHSRAASVTRSMN